MANIQQSSTAAAQEPIGEFILRLQGCPDLEGVNLKYATEKIVQDSKGTEFQIDAGIAGTAVEKPKKEDNS